MGILLRHPLSRLQKAAVVVWVVAVFSGGTAGGVAGIAGQLAIAILVPLALADLYNQWAAGDLSFRRGGGE